MAYICQLELILQFEDCNVVFNTLSINNTLESKLTTFTSSSSRLYKL